MSNLSPEKRLDKNGRLVTRHVKLVDRSPATNIPGPQVSSPKVSYTKTQLAPQEHLMYDFVRMGIEPNDRLNKVFGPKGDATLRFTVSDVEFYDVLSTTTAELGIHLLARGIKTADDARAELRKVGAEEYIIDRRGVTDELLKLRVSPRYYSNVCLIGDDLKCGDKELIDAAEAQSIKSMREWEVIPTVPMRVLHGAIELEDLKSLGMQHLPKIDSYGNILGHLTSKKRRDSLSVEELKVLVDSEVSNRDDQRRSAGGRANNFEPLLRAGRKFGVDRAILLKEPGSALNFDSRLRAPMGELPSSTVDEAWGYIRYNDQLLWALFGNHDERTSSAYMSQHPRRIMRLKDAGIPIESAARGYEAELSVDQIIAIHREGIESSVISGWL